MLKRVLRKVRAVLGMDWLDEQLVYKCKFSDFFDGVEDGPVDVFNGVAKKSGFDFIRRFGLVPDALGPAYTEEHTFVIYITTPRAATRKGRAALRKWFIDNGLDREYIDDKYVQFHAK